MKNKVFVTGATGKVGAEIVGQLLRRGVSVNAGAQNPDKACARFGDAVDFAEAIRDVGNAVLCEYFEREAHPLSGPDGKKHGTVIVEQFTSPFLLPDALATDKKRIKNATAERAITRLFMSCYCITFSALHFSSKRFLITMICLIIFLPLRGKPWSADLGFPFFVSAAFGPNR